MAADSRVSVGTKILPEQARLRDRATMGVLLTGSPEVEGQTFGRHACPWCQVECRPNGQGCTWFQCGSCGSACEF